VPYGVRGCLGDREGDVRVQLGIGEPCLGEEVEDVMADNRDADNGMTSGVAGKRLR
jgi:hypothetical protein